MANSKREKHKCPPLPEGLSKVTPQAWHGEDAVTARKMWYAWLRIVDKQRPLPRKNH